MYKLIIQFEWAMYYCSILIQGQILEYLGGLTADILQVILINIAFLDF